MKKTLGVHTLHKSVSSPPRDCETLCARVSVHPAARTVCCPNTRTYTQCNNVRTRPRCCPNNRAVKKAVCRLGKSKPQALQERAEPEGPLLPDKIDNQALHFLPLPTDYVGGAAGAITENGTFRENCAWLSAAHCTLLIFKGRHLASKPARQPARTSLTKHTLLAAATTPVNRCAYIYVHTIVERRAGGRRPGASSASRP